MAVEGHGENAANFEIEGWRFVDGLGLGVSVFSATWDNVFWLSLWQYIGERLVPSFRDLDEFHVVKFI